MNDETDPGPPENAVWPPPIRRDGPPSGVGASTGRGTGLALAWAAGIVLNLACGHKDFPESLRHNLCLLALDAGCWLAAGLLWWGDVRAEWRRPGSLERWGSFGRLLRERRAVGLLLAACAVYGLYIWTYRAVSSDFW